MGRGKGRGKKQTVIASHEDHGSGEEEKVPNYRRRGRPQKPLKDSVHEKEEAKEIEENGTDSKSSKGKEKQTDIETERKRKRSSLDKENIDTVKEENAIDSKSNTVDTIKLVGYRQNGSRRKNKPRRAAGAVVECH